MQKTYAVGVTLNTASVLKRSTAVEQRRTSFALYCNCALVFLIMLSGAMPIQAQSTCTIGNLTYKNDLLYTLGFGCTPLTSITFGKLNTNQFDVASPTFLTAADIRTANFPFLDVRNYGLVGDGTQLTTCSIMANTNAVHCTTSNFTAADVNKMAVFLGAGGSGGNLFAHIAGFTDSNDVTLDTLAGTSSSSYFYYGTDNQSAWCNSVIGNCSSSSSGSGLYTPQPGRRIFVPRGTYFFSDSIGERACDQIVGPDQSAADFVLFNADANHEFLYMGAYKSGTTWAQDNSCGAETGVRGILFSTPTSGAQVCIETLKYSGFNIDHDWFECGVGIQSEGTFGNISNNTFDGSTWLGINLIDYGNNNYSTGTHTLIVAQQPILFSEAIRTSDNWN